MPGLPRMVNSCNHAMEPAGNWMFVILFSRAGDDCQG